MSKQHLERISILDNNKLGCALVCLNRKVSKRAERIKNHKLDPVSSSKLVCYHCSIEIELGTKYYSKRSASEVRF